MYIYDSSYLLYMLPAMLLSLLAQLLLSSTYKKYKSIANARGLTGSQAAQMILSANGIYDVGIQGVSGSLSDFYDPSNKTLNLSMDTAERASVASVAIAAHECGHAIQHATGYKLLALRAAVVPMANIGSRLSFLLIFVGFLLNLAGLTLFGIGLFSFVVIFQLITLPVELDASRRALIALEGSAIVSTEEHAGAKRVLTAAALTYVAATITAILQLLRLLSLVSRRR